MSPMKEIQRKRTRKSSAGSQDRGIKSFETKVIGSGSSRFKRTRPMLRQVVLNIDPDSCNLNSDNNRLAHLDVSTRQLKEESKVLEKATGALEITQVGKQCGISLDQPLLKKARVSLAFKKAVINEIKISKKSLVETDVKRECLQSDREVELASSVMKSSDEILIKNTTTIKPLKVKKSINNFDTCALSTTLVAKEQHTNVHALDGVEMTALNGTDKINNWVKLANMGDGKNKSTVDSIVIHRESDLSNKLNPHLSQAANSITEYLSNSLIKEKVVGYIQAQQQSPSYFNSWPQLSREVSTDDKINKIKLNEIITGELKSKSDFFQTPKLNSKKDQDSLNIIAETVENFKSSELTVNKKPSSTLKVSIKGKKKGNVRNSVSKSIEIKNINKVERKSVRKPKKNKHIYSSAPYADHTSSLKDNSMSFDQEILKCIKYLEEIIEEAMSRLETRFSDVKGATEAVHRLEKLKKKLGLTDLEESEQKAIEKLVSFMN